MALKIIFMGTPEFAVPILKSIYYSDHKLQAVYTQSPKKSKRGQKINLSPVHKYSNQIKISVKHPINLKDDAELEIFKKLNPDVVVVAAFGKILPSKMLNLENIKFINVHASLLPRWRGAAPIQRSIIEMDKETGISIMKMIPELDAGPYLLQKKIRIEKNDNFVSLSKKLSDLGSKLIIESLDLIEKKNYKFTDQDVEKATYAKKIDKKESKINWNETSSKILSKIKGLNPFPGTWFIHKGKRLKIIEAIEVHQSGEAGKILDDNLTIGCKDNAIKVLFVQKEGRKILSSKDFLAGYKIRKGEKLF